MWRKHIENFVDFIDKVGNISVNSSIFSLLGGEMLKYFRVLKLFELSSYQHTFKNGN
jgi:hypothetical protein